jgi:hypothetical protein
MASFAECAQLAFDIKELKNGKPHLDAESLTRDESHAQRIGTDGLLSPLPVLRRL